MFKRLKKVLLIFHLIALFSGIWTDSEFFGFLPILAFFTVVLKIPKPLIEIRGKPMLYYIISYFKKYGIKNFILGTGYKSNLIKKYINKSHEQLDCKLIDSGDVDIIQRIINSRDKIHTQFILITCRYINLC